MRVDLTASRRIGKTRVADRETSLGRSIAWPDVLRVLSADRTRSRVLERYRAAGHTPDAFGTSRASRACMADTLARAEDALEIGGSSTRMERAAIRDLRRRLEMELEP
jgi:hypothetical protein